LRYIAPVSRYRKPSLSARPRATVLLPAPAGPSIATISAFSSSRTRRLVGLLADLTGDGEIGQGVVEAGEADLRAVRARDRHRLARDDPRDGGEHREPVVAERVDRAAARTCRHAADHEAVGAALDMGADRAQSGDDGVDPVGFLRPELRRSRDGGRAARHR